MPLSSSATQDSFVSVTLRHSAPSTGSLYRVQILEYIEYLTTEYVEPGSEHFWIQRGTEEQRHMNEIERLWEDFRLPIRDGLYFADGNAYDVALSPATPSGFRVLESFDLHQIRKNVPDWTSEVDGLKSIELTHGGFLWGGEGSHGSEGFLARLTPGRSLAWAIFLTESNPFQEIQLYSKIASFVSTSGIEITVDIDDPRRPVIETSPP
jgi:hypothetical protein